MLGSNKQNHACKKPNPQNEKPSIFWAFLAGGEGFEPPYTDSESAVLPLDEPPTINWKLLYQIDLKRARAKSS